MLDALMPAARAFGEAVAGGQTIDIAWRMAAAAAEAGAAATASMKPRLGRASYLGERAIGLPDGGAKAVAVWLEAVASARDADA